MNNSLVPNFGTFFFYTGFSFLSICNLIILGVYNSLRLTCLADVYNFSLSLICLRTIFSFGYLVYYLFLFYNFMFNMRLDKKTELKFYVMKQAFLWLWFVYPFLQAFLLFTYKYNTSETCFNFYKKKFRFLSLILYSEFAYLAAWIIGSIYQCVDYLYSDEFIGVSPREDIERYKRNFKFRNYSF